MHHFTNMIPQFLLQKYQRLITDCFNGQELKFGRSCSIRHSIDLRLQVQEANLGGYEIRLQTLSDPFTMSLTNSAAAEKLVLNTPLVAASYCWKSLICTKIMHTLCELRSCLFFNPQFQFCLLLQIQELTHLCYFSGR